MLRLTLEEDWPYFDENDPADTYTPLYVDAVVSNPPYSQAWEPANKENDPRYARFGLAPKGKTDYAFLLHDLFHIKPDGIMTIVLPHGVLFRGGEEGQIRKNLIENNHIDTVIGLPANMLLEKKWIYSLTASLYKLPEGIVDGLLNKIQALQTKYETTYFEIEKELKETEKMLCSMIDELEGNEFDMKGLGEFKSLLAGE